MPGEPTEAAAGEPRAVPTVVVARRPVPGMERRFERWLRRLDLAAQRAPGYVDSAIEPPGGAHPGEWVIVYRFASPGTLRAWLDSPARARLMQSGAHLVQGRAREQVLALAEQADPVTAVSSFRVRAGHEAEFDAFQEQLDAALASWPGFLRVERFDPVHGVQDETINVFSFDTREHLDAWLESEQRAALLADAGEHFTGAGPTVNVVGGFAGWFDAEGPPVKQWKQALVVFAAIAPVSIVLTALRLWLLPDANWVAAGLVSTAIGVAILTWLLMPFLTRLLAGWLRR